MMGTNTRELKIFSGTAHPSFARRICSELGIELSGRSTSAFPTERSAFP